MVSPVYYQRADNMYKDPDMSSGGEIKKQDLGYLLKKTQHALRMHMDNALKKLSLTTPQYAVLSQLELNPGVSNADLARASFVTAQTMHGIVKNLEKLKLIKRKSDSEHGRVLCTELTNKGRNLLIKARVLIQSCEKEMLSTFSDKNARLLDQLLNECISNLLSTST